MWNVLQSKTNFPSGPGEGLLIETSGTPRIWESPKDKTKLHNVLKQRGVIVLPVKDFPLFSVKQTEFQQKKTSLFSQFWLVSTNQNKKDRNTMKYAPTSLKGYFSVCYFTESVCFKHFCFVSSKWEKEDK